jgi:hypothetical protein
MGKFVQMNASLRKSTLKFLVYRASVASLAAPLRTPEPTPRPLRDHPYFISRYLRASENLSKKGSQVIRLIRFDV